MGNKCPFCGGEKCYRSGESGSNAHLIDCEKHHIKAYFGAEIFCARESAEKKRFENLAYEYIMNHRESEKNGVIYHFINYSGIEQLDENTVNLAEISYPVGFSEIVDRTLMNLYHAYPDYSNSIYKGDVSPRAVFSENGNEDGNKGMLDVLRDLGYLRTDRSESSFMISASGWKRIEELSEGGMTKKQAFIAMSFDDSYDEICQAIKHAITQSGYTPVRMDEHEHNNQIVPEMLHEIEESAYVVLDVTCPNYGAYYEAGYALAKGKEVIVCKKKGAGENKPHFDVAQRPIIEWENEEDLIDRLGKRVKATVK